MRTPFGEMTHGQRVSVLRDEWERKTGVPAANGAEYTIGKGVCLRLFDVNEPRLLVDEQVGVECIATAGNDPDEDDPDLSPSA